MDVRGGGGLPTWRVVAAFQVLPCCHTAAVVPRLLLQTPPEVRGNQQGPHPHGHHYPHGHAGSVVNDVSTLSAPSTFIGDDGGLAVWQRVPFRLELSWEFQQWMSKHGQKVCDHRVPVSMSSASGRGVGFFGSRCAPGGFSGVGRDWQWKLPCTTLLTW